jgi:hypothetical protein
MMRPELLSPLDQHAEAVIGIIENGGREAKALFEGELLVLLLAGTPSDVTSKAIATALQRLSDARATGFCDHCGTVPISTGRHVWGCPNLLRSDFGSIEGRPSHIVDRDPLPKRDPAWVGQIPMQRTAASDFRQAHVAIPVAPAAAWIQPSDEAVAARQAQLDRERPLWKRIARWFR